ncbi:hypothetical protein ID866_6419 [Astraeus odoratus]|nr:hypothetical protein ID866_6419 [Astraeus odoratus]
MDEDLIVVDDVEEQHAGPSSLPNGAHPPQQPQRTRPLRAAAEQAMATTLRLRDSAEPSERTTRSSTAKLKLQPKLKLKLSERAVAQAPGMSHLGSYDRELDSDDEDLTFEEQFILRMPPGEDCEKLHSRRGVFHIGNNLYSFKLVDLPCIIESQKTLDNKQMFKVADICQMLVVENRIQEEEVVIANRNVNVDEFIWQHGITPPLHHVRKRRFRKRVNKRTIESVEEEVERLLQADNDATDVKFEVLDNKRFEDALKKLSADLEMKRAQRDEIKERQLRKKEGIAVGDVDTDPEGPAQDGADADDNEAQDGDLFGSDDPTAMDIG